MLRILNELSRIDQSAVNIVVNTGFPLAEAETPRIEVQGREPPPKLENTTVDFVESLWKSVSTENVFGPSGRKVSKTSLSHQLQNMGVIEEKYSSLPVQETV